MEYRKFILEWLKRAERKNCLIDDADRFISLWIAFNGWLREEYGENELDGALINKVVVNPYLEAVFNDLKTKDSIFKKNLEKLSQFNVINMRNPNNENNYRRYDGSFGSFIRVIYQIRCNLFHGRKSFEEDKNDYKLIVLALKLLGPLFQQYCRTNRII